MRPKEPNHEPVYSYIRAPLVLLALAGCTSQGKSPPRISLDEPVQAQPLPELPKPVEVVAVPKVLPMPGQMKPLPDEAGPAPEPADEKVRVSRANQEARVAPTREVTSTRSRSGPTATARCTRSMPRRDG